jgi:hypothetical protein
MKEGDTHEKTKRTQRRTQTFYIIGAICEFIPKGICGFAF